MPKKIKIEPEKLDELMDKSLVSVVISVNEMELRGKGESIIKAIESITLPVKIRTFANLTVKDGKRISQMQFNVFKIKRLFSHKVYREIMSSVLFRRLH